MLAQILSAIPRDFSFPVAIAQHRGRKIGNGLLPALQHNCGLPVLEPEDKERIRPGQVFAAPADYHLLVDRNGFVVSKEAPELYSRPSIDVLFETAADAFFSGVIGVILTGSSRDGARCPARIKALGGVVIAQDPATAENRVTPAAAIESANVDKVPNPGEIGAFLTQLTQTRS